VEIFRQPQGNSRHSILSADGLTPECHRSSVPAT
jgi:hypothetical protein